MNYITCKRKVEQQQPVKKQQQQMDENCEFPDFDAATEFVKTNSGFFTTESLLILYSRFKQVTIGKCNTPKPGFFDFQGKQKWEAWNQLGDMPKDVAAMQYVEEVSRVCPEWESQSKQSSGKPSSSGNQSVFGVAVSTMVNTDTVIDDELKTIFDWCKEGNTEQVTRLLRNTEIDIDQKDSEGMTMLHWACDRGELAMVETLLKHKASVNVQESDGQTPLHYAVICEHPEVVKCLLKHKAKTDIQDIDGQATSDLDTTSEIKNILASFPHR